MAIKPLNSVAGFSVGEAPSTVVIYANGDITTTNITTTGVSNLNSVSNVKITGGSAGQVLSTDGSGNLSFITIGTASLNNGTSNVTVLNSGNILFSVGGSANVGTFTSTGLNVSGYITSTGNVTAGNANLGNAVTANYFIGSGANLTNINGANVTGEVDYAAVANSVAGANVTGTVANANYAAYAGTVTSSSQSNITSLGTLTGLDVNATVNALSFSSNVSTGTAPLSVQSTTKVANLNADLLDGYDTSVSTAANTVVVRDANGNVSANYFIGDGSQLTGIDTSLISNGTSNVKVLSSGNVTVSVAGNSNVVTFTGTGANISGYANVTGNLEAGNISANVANLTTANVTGNIEAGGVKTDNLYYANGTPWDLQQPAGSNNQIQYNDNGSFGASANFAFDDSTQLLTIEGASAQVNVGANTYISNSQIWLGNTDWVNGASYTQLTDSYVSVQDGGVGPGSRYGAITTSGISYADDVYSFDVASTSGIYQYNSTLGTQFNAYPNAAIRSILGNNSSFLVLNDELSWFADGGVDLFLANATGAYHSQKFQAPQIVSNVATGTAPFVVTSTTQVANLNAANAGYATSAGTAVTVTASSQPNITSTGTLTELVVANTAYADAFSARTGSDLTIGVLGQNANIILAPLGTGIVNFSGKNISNIGNANVGNLGAAQVLATANITAPQLISNTSTGTAPFVVSSTTRVANLNVATAGNADSATNASAVLNNVASTGTVYPTFISSTANGNYSLTSNTAYSANIANGYFEATLLGGTLTTAAQPNITSVGTLTSLSVTGNIDANNLSTTNKIVAGNGLEVTSGPLTVLSGNLDVTGNINVTGNLNYSNVTDLVVGDPLIYIGANNTGDLYDLGIVGSYNNGTYQHTGIARNAADDVWTFFDGVVAEPTTVIDWANAVYPTVKLGNLIATGNANIAGTANVVGNASVGGILDVTGNVTAANVYANSGTIGALSLAGTLTTAAQPNITSVGTLTSLAVTGNVTSGNVYANSGTIGAQTLKGEGGNISNIQGANVSGTVSSATTAGTVTTAAQPNITSVGTLTSLSVTGNVSAGNISATNGNLTTANVSGNVVLGNSSVTTTVTWASVTTTATTANQTIASFSATGITGVEFLVKGVDSTGSKYSVATVQAVTDGTDVDYATFGGVNLGGYTGSLAVNIVGGQIRLQVTPASSNSTVWTTQYRLI